MKRHNKIAGVIAVVILLVALVVVAAFHSANHIKEAAETRRNIFMSLNLSGDVLFSLVDAETSQQAYLLTGEKIHLQHYLAVHDIIKDTMEKLRHKSHGFEILGNPDELLPLITSNLAYLNSNVELRRSGNIAAALANEHSGKGWQSMNLIRAKLSDFRSQQELKLRLSEENIQKKMRNLYIAVAVSSLLIILLAAAFIYFIYRESKQALKETLHLETMRFLKMEQVINEEMEKAHTSLQTSNDKTERLLSELEIYQIEMEGQNTELQRSQNQLETQQIELELQNNELTVAREIAVQNEALQRDGSAMIRAVLDNVADGIVTISAKDGFVKTVNPAAEQMFGYSAAEIYGQKLGLLIPTLLQEQYNSSIDFYRGSEEELGSGHGREFLGKRMDGSVFPLELSVSEMWLSDQHYFTGILRDISSRKIAEEALAKATALQNAIFNSTSFSIIATNIRGDIKVFNVGAENMLGYMASEVVNKLTPAEILDPQEVMLRTETMSDELATPVSPGFETLIFKAFRNIEDVFELTCIRKDGSRFPMLFSVTTLRNGQNSIIGYLFIGTDNTARKSIETERVRLEQVLLDKNAELECATRIAEKANLAKSDFLSSMSHELRTPLSAILGFAQLMEAGSTQPDPSQKRCIEQILNAGWYLLELINEILDLAVIESGKIPISLEPVSLLEILHECEIMVGSQAVKHGISVTLMPCDTDYRVMADRIRVKQVLINLLSNAIKYNRDNGSVRIESAVNGPDSVRISVYDTGEGLTPEQLTQLFQPFNRLGQKPGIEQGAGIGLVVSKRLVELMGGVIGVESTVGVGSVFWIELNLTTEPLNVVDAVEPAMTDSTQLQGAEPLYTLLYVEDSPANLMLVEDIIARRPDIRMLSAPDGKSGIELARAALPDVILMDINLPGISGIDAMKILLVDPATAHIPVVALSANAIPHDIKKGLKAGFFSYLTKPININEFMKTLDVALEYAKTKSQT